MHIKWKTKAISSKKLFNSKRAHNIKVSSKKEENNTPVVGSILGGLTAIGTGIGLSFGATRKE